MEAAAEDPPTPGPFPEEREEVGLVLSAVAVRPLAGDGALSLTHSLTLTEGGLGLGLGKETTKAEDAAEEDGRAKRRDPLPGGRDGATSRNGSDCSATTTTSWSDSALQEDGTRSAQRWGSREGRGGEGRTGGADHRLTLDAPRRAEGEGDRSVGGVGPDLRWRRREVGVSGWGLRSVSNPAGRSSLEMVVLSPRKCDCIFLVN